MLKRTTKITSLLIVAASIVSMVPAMAADIKKVAAEEGTVYGAKSNADGTFYIDAELNGTDEAIYSYKDGKYTKVNGADPGDTIGDVIGYDGKNYLEMNSGDYYVDLKTGETTDENIRDDVDDDASTALRKKIKADDDGRFAESTYTGNTVPADKTVENIPGTVATTILGPVGTWRQYFYNLDKKFSDGSKDVTTQSLIYADKDGKYIDADYNLGKIGVYNTTGASVNIENTEDTYDLSVEGTNYKIRAQIETLITCDDDADSITRTAALSIWGTTDGGEHYTNLTSKVAFGSSNNHHKQVVSDEYSGPAGNKANYDSVRVIQRISKAQDSDDIDGIKYAKDVKTYFITDEDGTAENLYGLNPGWALLTHQTDGTFVSVDYTDVLNGGKEVKAQTINLKSEQGYNYVDLDSDKDDSIDSSDVKARAIGCGDVYVLANGYIQIFSGKAGKFVKLEKVDGGMINFSPSIPIFAIAWNKDDEIYSIITPGASAGDKKDTTIATDATKTAGAVTTVDTTTATKAGWAKATDGTWSFVKADGTKATAWLQDGTTWYYLNSAGVMQTGWINDNGTWYYCNGSGAMLANTIVDGYVLGASGAWVK